MAKSRRWKVDPAGIIRAVEQMSPAEKRRMAEALGLSFLMPLDRPCDRYDPTVAVIGPRDPINPLPGIYFKTATQK